MHGLDHVVAVQATHPRRPHNCDTRTVSERLKFASQFGASIHTLRVGSIGFNIWFDFCAVKNIISTDVHKMCANRIAGFGYPTDRCPIDQHCGIGIVFTRINSSKGCAVNDRIRVNRHQCFVHRITTRDINRVDVNSDSFVTSSRNNSHQILTELTICSSNENFHNYELITDQRGL
ncbi:unannotated protein [freshwater metagenome]|uniref:Unannotated protein n=1 Tax=freshwater metagenome TaxID=449393 RepID=A0A6J7F7T6_9ZZZZ